VSFLASTPPSFGVIAPPMGKLHLLGPKMRPLCRPGSRDVQLVWEATYYSERPRVCLSCLRITLIEAAKAALEKVEAT
jgi:hypothetical protein